MNKRMKEGVEEKKKGENINNLISGDWRVMDNDKGLAREAGD